MAKIRTVVFYILHYISRIAIISGMIAIQIYRVMT
jgi:hypothetical protein